MKDSALVFRVFPVVYLVQGYNSKKLATVPKWLYSSSPGVLIAWLIRASSQHYGGHRLDSYLELWNLFRCSFVHCQETPLKYITYWWIHTYLRILETQCLMRRFSAIKTLKCLWSIHWINLQFVNEVKQSLTSYTTRSNRSQSLSVVLVYLRMHGIPLALGSSEQ